MDDARFQEAQQEFVAKDYRAAAEGFLAAAGGSGGPGNGEAYHLAGNALMKLRKYQHAATVYEHALRDPDYTKRTSVLCNLGTAKAAVGEYAEAVTAFDEAGKDLAYTRHHLVLRGRAGALYKMGRFDESAEDYRAATADPANADPGKAYNNLGLALAASGRLPEAVEAYKGALAAESYQSKGKAAVNLGLTYSALGLHAEAVRELEMAVDGYGHTLSDPALDALERSRAAIGEAPRRETIEGWRTGELPPVPAPGGAAPDADPLAPGEEDSRFFTITDTEMKEIDRANRRREREDRRADHNPWARAAGVAVVVVLVVAACAGVFFAGFGWPTQRATVGGMLDAYHGGRAVTDFWVAAPPADVGKEMVTIPPTFKDFSIDGIDRSAFVSKVRITVTLDKGAPLHYRISLSREGVGWKVVGIDNDWGSTAGS